VSDLIRTDWIEKAQTLSELNKGLAGCLNCSLCESGTGHFPGSGPVGAPLMIVLEPPVGRSVAGGRLPVVGAEAELLGNIVSKGLKMSQDDVYVTPICKCSVPDDFKPDPWPLRVCSHILHKEIALVGPKVVLAMGPSCSDALSGGRNISLYLLRRRKPRITPLRIPLRMSFGLASMVEDPIIKKEFWRDLKEVMLTMDGRD
jgi:DNA polymerase